MRLRRVLRSPAAHWAVALVLAAVTGTTVSGFVGRAQAAALRFGALRPVLVATTALTPGALLRPADADVREVPAAFVPPGALSRRPRAKAPPVVVVPVAPGEILLRTKLAPAGLSPVAARLPPGTRGVAVPTAGDGPPLRPGDVVDVVASFDAAAGPAGVEPAAVVAPGAVVLHVGREAVTIAVAGEDLAQVAFALANAAVFLALSGTPPP